MSALTDFYMNGEPTTDGLYFEDILRWEDDEFEECHNHIQWLFPLAQPSQFNKTAPIFSMEDLFEFRNNSILKNNALRSFEKATSFYGLNFNHFGMNYYRVYKKELKPYWWNDEISHHHLRISRILRSMRLMGHESISKELFIELTKDSFESETVKYWADAAFGPIDKLEYSKLLQKETFNSKEYYEMYLKNLQRIFLKKHYNPLKSAIELIDRNIDRINNSPIDSDYHYKKTLEAPNYLKAASDVWDRCQKRYNERYDELGNRNVNYEPSSAVNETNRDLSDFKRSLDNPGFVQKISTERENMTIKDLKQKINDMDDDALMVICIDGHFKYVSEIKERLVSTWGDAIWVTENEESEFPIEEAVNSGKLKPALYLKGTK